MARDLSSLTWEDLDGMVTGDPLILRDVAWQLLRERDEARAALERERTEHAQWSFEAGRQAGEFIRGLQEQTAALTAELKAATIAARRFAVSDELLGRLGSQVGAEPVEVDP